jgi:hypothetical protein
MTLELLDPWGSRHLLWPEEVWVWVLPNASRRLVFSAAEHVHGFRQDPETGTVSYDYLGGPQGCRVQTRIIPTADTVTVEHHIRNESSTVILGGTPCLQAVAAEGTRWRFDQAKRTFVWTRQDGFTWSSDTRRSGKTLNPERRAYCAAYSLFPLLRPSVFGRSPDHATSPLIGYVDLARNQATACISSNASEVALGLYTCIHSKTSLQVRPGESHISRYRLYFVPADLQALAQRVQRDFPQYQIQPTSQRKLALAQVPQPWLSFEDPRQLPSLEVVGARVEPAMRRRLSVENLGARTFGVTHGRNALLCELEPEGIVTLPSLPSAASEADYLTLDATVAVEQKVTLRVALVGGKEPLVREFELLPGAPRRCVIDLRVGTFEVDERLRLQLGLASAEPAAVQIDCVCLYGPDPS